ncbi:MAG: hypothetical protein NT105_18245 [Verrucomicrobia bacterium]|nr:hypothetical protein [Verrucomicrobiota bacterium]
MFDPSLPADNSPLSSSQMRGQLTGLKADIDAIPAGPPGPAGPAGETGPAGPPGEVTTQQMNDTISGAINGTPRNVDSIGTLDIGISDPPTQGEVQAILDKLNALILGLKRNI